MFNTALVKSLSETRTPFYFYDMKVLEQTLHQLYTASRKYQYHIHYAMKANSNDPILSLIRKYGFGVDCVSGNEIRQAMKKGFEANQIVFAGVGKTDDEIQLAINQQILSLNCESVQEMIVIDEIARATGTKVNIALRLNPNINANTHPGITTGTQLNKFGIDIDEINEVICVYKTLKHIKIHGLHFHIGSQINDINVYQMLCNTVNTLIPFFEQEGISISLLNLGGGLGINYTDPNRHLIPDFEYFFRHIHSSLHIPDNIEVHFELGRSIVGQCGSLITKVLFVKQTPLKKFIIADAGMTELIRPALYNSYHKIENLSSVKECIEYDVVGPVCETSDSFGSQISLPETSRGDILAIRSAGAYGEVMASRYNLRDLPLALYSTDIKTNASDY